MPEISGIGIHRADGEVRVEGELSSIHANVTAPGKQVEVNPQRAIRPPTGSLPADIGAV